MLTADQKQFVKELGGIVHHQRPMDTFRDWLLMASVIFRNNTMPRDDAWEKREAEYMDIVHKYAPDVVPNETPMNDPKRDKLNALLRLIGLFSQAHVENRFGDFLGPIYSELGANAAAGQFFTPENLAYCMAQITLGDRPAIEKLCNGKGYFTVNDPACGAGVLLLTPAKVVHEAGLEPADVMVAFATDIDVLCFRMSYLQLAASGVPAVVQHGDSLAVEVWDTAYTSPLAVCAMLDMQRTPKAHQPEPIQLGQQDLFAEVAHW